MTVHPSPLSAPVVSPWHELRSRVPVLPGRLVGTVAGLVGIALAVPLVFLPTYSVTILGGNPGSNFPQFQQSFWSWGRIADTTPGVDPQFDYRNYAALVFFIASLVVGVVACVLYAVRRGPDGRILGAVGIAWAAGQVISDFVRRLGEATSDFYGNGDDLHFDVYLGGQLQALSVVFLAVAVGAIAWRPLVALARAAWTRADRARAAWAWMVRLVRRSAARAKAAEPEPEGPPPRVGIATIRDARPTYDHPGWRTTEGVGFSDDPSSDPDRFRPPR